MTIYLYVYPNTASKNTAVFLKINTTLIQSLAQDLPMLQTAEAGMTSEETITL